MPTIPDHQRFVCQQVRIAGEATLLPLAGLRPALSSFLGCSSPPTLERAVPAVLGPFRAPSSNLSW